jgi:hypothetical protein
MMRFTGNFPDENFEKKFKKFPGNFPALAITGKSLRCFPEEDQHAKKEALPAFPPGKS